ncbi:MAG: universal stress protein [Anaerolineales bacterium]|nr:universal stress protein [Anaerolineales bacterium]
MIREILLATDGSAAAERAASFAASLASRYNARLTVLHAFAPLPRHLGEPAYSRVVYRTLEEAQKLLDDIAKRLREMGVADVVTEFIEGPAADVILNVAETRKPDLIVVGARGLGLWQGLLLGSVSMAVTQRAQCPVLVVK